MAVSDPGLQQEAEAAITQEEHDRASAAANAWADAKLKDEGPFNEGGTGMLTRPEIDLMAHGYAHGHVAGHRAAAESRDQQLADECEKYGLPYGLAGLLRHIYGNRDAAFGAKDSSIKILEARLKSRDQRTGDIEAPTELNESEMEAAAVEAVGECTEYKDDEREAFLCGFRACWWTTFDDGVPEYDRA